MRPLRAALLLGFGLGGFVDGIVMHQLLQWHHLVSAQVDDLGDNITADGVFHAVTWTVTVAATLFVVRAWRRGEIAPPWRAQLGAMIAGWGIFNLLDSANHFILGLHHIRDDLGGPASWDVAFLAFALLLIAVGGALAKRSPSAA